MIEKNYKYYSVKYFVFMYSNKERIDAFRQKIGLSNVGHEDDVILESCSEENRSNMSALDGSSTPCFYPHLPTIYDLRF